MSTKAPLEPQPPDLQPPWRTAARVELQLEARTFARDIVLPIADELDPQKGEMPRSLIDEMAAKGWFGITIPAELGGMGSACSNTALSRRNLPALGFRSAASWRGARDSVPKRSTNARRLEQLRRSAQGKWIGAIALSEPTAGSDLAAVQTRAIRQDGYWLLSGTKRWAGFALAADFIEV